MAVKQTPTVKPNTAIGSIPMQVSVLIKKMGRTLEDIAYFSPKAPIDLEKGYIVGPGTFDSIKPGNTVILHLYKMQITPAIIMLTVGNKGFVPETRGRYHITAFSKDTTGHYLNIAEERIPAMGQIDKKGVVHNTSKDVLKQHLIFSIPSQFENQVVIFIGSEFITEWVFIEARAFLLDKVL